VTGSSQSDEFAADSIFLGGEFKGGSSGSAEGLFWSLHDVDSLLEAEEVDVIEAERSGFGIVIVCIFSWAKQEEETQEEHVRNSVRLRGFKQALGVDGQGDDMERDGLDACWWIILFVVGFELALETEVELSRELQTGVGEAQ
jgi:hypothetical protein